MSPKKKDKLKEQSKVEKKAEKKEAKLHEDLNALQKEKDDLFEKLQRVSADYANFQKRVPKQITDSVAYEKERIIKSLLPALDNFDHTLQSAHTAESTDVLVEGIQIIHDQMLAILKSHGVEQIESMDQPFDPTRHEAMMQREETDKPDSTVLEEFQKGYALNERVIRPSKVIVNKAVIKEDPEETDCSGPVEIPSEDEDKEETSNVE
jgi:molecular chaperone GrpE